MTDFYYRDISPAEADMRERLFRGFERTQEVTRCWRKLGGEWVIKDIAFTDDWTEEEYAAVARDIAAAARGGGLAVGAFTGDGALSGFVTVEPEPMGSRGQYLCLHYIIVSRGARGRGVGRELFLSAMAFARERGGKKLYISAHSAVETQAFYRAMGCVEAEEYSARHVEAEPCDCQLECDCGVLPGARV